MIAIEYRNAGVSYGKEQVLQNFNLSIGKGEFLAVIGSSGSGKTTILKMVNGLVLPTSGKVFVNGTSTDEADLIRLRRGIGYVVQGNALFPHLTVEENIAFVPGLAKGRRGIPEKVDKLLDLVGLDCNLRKRYPRQLSGGQQQRVGIARALAASPDILLMDEPFGALDPIIRASLQNVLKQIHETTGITIMLVTHDMEEAMKLGSRALVLDNGAIMQCDKPEIIREHPACDFVKILLGTS